MALQQWHTSEWNDITKHNSSNSNTSMNSSTHGKSYVLRVYWWMIMVCEYRPYFYQMICEQHLSSHYAQKSQKRNVWKPFCTWCFKKNRKPGTSSNWWHFLQTFKHTIFGKPMTFCNLYYWRKAIALTFLQCRAENDKWHLRPVCDSVSLAFVTHQ